MSRNRIALVAALVAGFLAADGIRAQMPPIAAMRGEVGLGLLLRQLKTTAVLMQATAHPDDENNAMLAAMGWGRGARTAVVTATRGDGGQNEIGPELSDALAIARTEELISVHQLDSAEQYFTRAVDFGYSFSIDETFQKWGRQEILGDYVRHIRTIRPDIIIAMRPDGTGGGQHHQASAVISREAFLQAGDPTKFPEQIREGLRPWQPKKFYFTGRFGFPGEPPPPAGAALTTVDTGGYDPLLGESYAEIGSRARSNHKTQGMAQLLALPGPSSAGYLLAECAIPGLKEKGDASLFDGIDTSVPGLARFVPGDVPAALASGLAAIADAATAAERRAAEGGPTAAVAPLVEGLQAVRSLRAQLASRALTIPDDARFEIDSRLARKERQFVDAVLEAGGIRLEALADDGVVVAGQPVKLTVIAANRGTSPLAVKQIGFRGLDGEAGVCKPATVAAAGVYRCEAALEISRQARLTGQYWKRLPDAARYEFEPDAPFGLPFRPTPFRVQFDLEIGGAALPVERAVQHRYEGNIFSGEKRMELQVVPRLAVSLTPDIAILPAARGAAAARPAGRELRVTVIDGGKGPAEGEAALEVPAGWTVAPPSAKVSLAREDEAEPVRFTVTPPRGAKPGSYAIKAVVTSEGERFTNGYQVIEYPHTRRRHLIRAAEAALEIIDVAIAPRLNIGYVMGVGDQVPPAIEQLGARVTLIDADGLAFGDLSAFDAIVTGVRAYERRPDLRANNQRLLEYARRGGTVIVQYNKFEFNQAQYGPYPAKVSSNRVTDENAPVQVLVPDDPLMRWPNRIGDAAWRGWVQERGLYFLGEKDPKYVDLVQLEDPFPFNKGMKRGALVEAGVGKGRWIYVGLGLWRQLPAGTEGAYQLLANMLSVGKSPRAAAPARK
ncbi:MAG: PIG-L family deacetylase [Rhodospirillaceae bacterium]